MKLNTPTPQIRTHEGGVAKHIHPFQQLRRSVASCLLWEDEFYESGQTIADRIAELVPQCDPAAVAVLAVKARTKFKLRHVPLLLCRLLAQSGKLSSETLASVIQRPDELSEFLAIYWKDRRQPLSAQVKKGLAKAFTKFTPYQLQKYNRDGAIKLRDVLFLCHAKPLNAEMDKWWKQLVEGTLPTPDTWEVAISAAKTDDDRKGAWMSLLLGHKLGALALLRNLRNMREADVPPVMVAEALRDMKVERVLPFRFIAAATHAPGMEAHLETAMFRCLSDHPHLDGPTTLLIDVSGSMEGRLSSKSDLTRMDAACALAILLREICDCQVYTFSNDLVEVPPRHGFALRDAITNSQSHGGTYLGNAVRLLEGPVIRRLIVITDEQVHDQVPDVPGAYCINVASARNGVGYGAWTHIDGFSESVVTWLLEYESTLTASVSAPSPSQG